MLKIICKRLLTDLRSVPIIAVFPDQQLIRKKQRNPDFNQVVGLVFESICSLKIEQPIGVGAG